MAAAKIAYLLLLMMMLHVENVHTTFGQAARSLTSGLKDAMEDLLKGGNFALGSFSRSTSIKTISQQNRLDDINEIQDSLIVTILTLGILDIGGGALLPITDVLVDRLTVGKDFENTRKAFSLQGDEVVQKALGEFTTNIKSGEATTAAKNVLKSRKEAIAKAFEADIAKIVDDPLKMADNADLMKHLGKVKKMFKVKMAAKALGPVFDVVNIGLSAYSLHTTRVACEEDPKTCNYGAIVSSSLCIVSGIVGIAAFALAGTAFGPVGTVIALLLGITATLIELYWPPPVDHEGIEFRKRAELMFKMDKVSRMQLEANSHFLWSSGLENVDLYVINQGHFPNWMENIRKEIPGLIGDIKFGYRPQVDYNNDGRMKERIGLKGECDDIPRRGPTQLPAPQPGDLMCIYYQEGATDQEMTFSSTLTQGNTYNFGPSFYGITENWYDGHRATKPRNGLGGSHPFGFRLRNMKQPEHKGAMIFVNTNEVTNYKLTEAEEQDDESTNEKVTLRGLDIDTEKKFRDMGLSANDRNKFNDVVGIGDMRNLGDGDSIKIRTGLGRDALNIDGWVFRLDADLGENHNTLSFNGISKKPLKKRPGEQKDFPRGHGCGNTDILFYPRQIQGVKFNPKDGLVTFITNRYNSCTRQFWSPGQFQEQSVGSVKGVGILNGSPFDYDEYTLYALQTDTTNAHDHYTVFKFEGKAKYIFDATSFKSEKFDGVIPHFKIIDGTKRKTGNRCAWKPKLFIENLEVGAEPKDILFKNDKITIYERKSGERTEAATISFFTSCPGEVKATDTSGTVIIEGEVKDLDTMEYTGSRFDHRFESDTRGSPGADSDDIAYLQCPPQKVTVTTKIQDVSTIVVCGKFMDSCHIDESNKITVKVKDTKRGDGKTLVLRFHDVAMFGKKQKIVRVNRIVNEFGEDIVNLDTFGNNETFDLFDAYTAKTGDSLITQSNLQQGVKDNLRACIRRAEHLRAKRNGQSGVGNINTGDFTEDQLNEICDDA